MSKVGVVIAGIWRLIQIERQILMEEHIFKYHATNNLERSQSNVRLVKLRKESEKIEKHLDALPAP